MELNFLLPQDFNDFEARFPDAYRFLTHTQLLRERDYLVEAVTEPHTKWQKDRLRELDFWYANTMKPLCNEQEVSVRINNIPVLDKADPNADKDCWRCHGTGRYTAIDIGEYDETPMDMICSCTTRQERGPHKLPPRNPKDNPKG